MALWRVRIRYGVKARKTLIVAFGTCVRRCRAGLATDDKAFASAPLPRLDLSIGIGRASSDSGKR